MRIAFVITSLARGGAEKVLCWLAADRASRGDAVSMITLRGPDVDAYVLDPRVERLSLGEPPTNGVFRNVYWVRSLRSAIRRIRPEVVVSFMDQVNVLVILASRGLGIPIVVSERVDPSMERLNPVFRVLRLVTYHGADCLVVQTATVRRWFALRGLGARAHVVANAATWTDLADRRSGSRREVISIGRLAHQKGQDLLVEAFARIARGFPDWDLVLYGEGPAQNMLEERIASYALQGRIRLPGRTENVAQALVNADLFVLSSRYEGFPNALLEAMAQGLAVVSFNCPSGPAEIIRHGVDGLLVPALDVSALATAMAALMADEGARLKLGSHARDVRERFSESRILREWGSVIDRAVLAPTVIESP